MFARVDVGGIALAALNERRGKPEDFEVARHTAPGLQDLGVAANQLNDDGGCHIVVACGMPGTADLDRLGTHEASLSILVAQRMPSKSVLEAFVHEIEGDGDDAKLLAICTDRCAKHAPNAHDRRFAPETLIASAGMGVRQGGPDVGPMRLASQS